MFGIGTNELVIILLFGFLIFGPDKLPAMAKTIGQAIARFRTAQAEMTRVIKTEVYDPDAEDPFKNPLDALSKIENSAQKEDRGESFTARKARYDKQRAAKKAAEERRAETAAKKAAAQAATDTATEAADAASQTAGAVTGATTAAATTAAATTDTAPATRASSAGTSGGTSQEPPKKKLTADELYGTTSKAKKPSAKKVAAVTSASSAKDANGAKQATDEAARQAKAQAKTAEEATDAPAEASSTPDSAPSANQGEGE